MKPQNVLLNGNGVAKVTDFGIARELDVQHGMTQTGTVLGTSDYISPEQAQGNRVSAHSDVYSLGVVLYELLTGVVPFAGDNFVAVAMRHVNDPPPDVLERRPDAPLRVAAAVARALAKDPQDRWPSMAEFRRELEACLAEAKAGHEEGTVILTPTPPVPRSLPHRSRPGRSIPWTRLVFLVGLLLLAAVLAVVLLGGNRDGPPKAGAEATTAVALSGVTAYDPYGNNHVENNALAPLATDGNPATYWTTELYYASFAALRKPGVGVVLDAGRRASVSHVTVTTDTPGFMAKIQAGDSPGGPFHDVSSSMTVARQTTFPLTNADARYFVIWITSLPPGSESAHVNEVTASS